ncbi:MAG: hypothetical protein CMJ46_05380 [Planctomyces sp.]|nr:hypothetical protein [Planctomyces sp.]
MGWIQSGDKWEVVWRGSNAHLRARPDPEIRSVKYQLRLYHSVWVNPHPEKGIETINIVSLNQIPALFTVAITGETEDTPAEIERAKLKVAQKIEEAERASQDEQEIKTEPFQKINFR